MPRLAQFSMLLRVLLVFPIVYRHSVSTMLLRHILSKAGAALAIMLIACFADAGTPCVPQWDPSIGTPGLDGEVLAATIDLNGNLITGGKFLSSGALALNYIARWDGTQWLAIGGGFDNEVDALALFGNDLYAGGVFTVAGGVAAPRVARWDGVQWGPAGGGFDNKVLALGVSSISGAPRLYAGGLFASADGAIAKRIAAWDGAAWSPLGSGITTPGGQSAVNVIAEVDLGGGPVLVAGGAFTVAGGQFASNIAAWDDATWTPMGSGLDGAVHALAVFDDGSGPALYVGGAFDVAGGVQARRVARWDGASWSAVGGTGSWGIGSTVRSLEVFDEGAGPVLIAGGDFLKADDASVLRLAKWDGAQWSPALGGADARVSMLLADPNDPAGRLYAGGVFGSVEGVSANAVGARIGCQTVGVTGDLNGDGVVDTADLGVLIANFGTSDPTSDINNDGIVDTADLGVLIANFGP